MDLRGYWKAGSVDLEAAASVAELVGAHLAQRGAFSAVLLTLAQQPAHSLVSVQRLAERLGSGVNYAELGGILDTLTRAPFLALTPCPAGSTCCAAACPTCCWNSPSTPTACAAACAPPPARPFPPERGPQPPRRTRSGPAPRPYTGAVPALSADLPDLRAALLAWFDRQGRDLPWRQGPEGQRDPYRAWVAEVLLQQTQVARGLGYYQRFLTAFPPCRPWRTPRWPTS